MPEHTDLDQAILDLEEERFKYQGIKEHRIRALMARHAPTAPSPITNYYQHLRVLIDHPTTTATRPALAARLTAARDT